MDILFLHSLHPYFYFNGWVLMSWGLAQNSVSGTPPCTQIRSLYSTASSEPTRTHWRHTPSSWWPCSSVGYSTRRCALLLERCGSPAVWLMLRATTPESHQSAIVELLATSACWLILSVQWFLVSNFLVGLNLLKMIHIDASSPSIGICVTCLLITLIYKSIRFYFLAFIHVYKDMRL